MTPFKQFCNGLHHARHEFNENVDELLAFAEVMAMKQNSLDMDDNGCFYINATGPIDEVIAIMHKQLEKLERIKVQRDQRN